MFQQNRMIKAIVFDFDGTLTELTLDFGEIRKDIEAIASRYLPAVSSGKFADLYILEMIYEVERAVGKRGARFREEAFARLRDMEVATANGKEPYTYTREVLRSLRDKGLKIGVMTRNCRDALLTIFPDVASFVDVIMTREDVQNVKPHPEHVSAVLRALEVVPSEAMVVGDHPTDIRSGERLDVVTVGVLTGRTTRAGFEEAGADYIINDIREVPDLVMR